MEKNALIKKIMDHMHQTFRSSDLPNFKEKQEGKVRDIYHQTDRVVMVTTDRLSAFDRILKQGIPYKGQALNQTSSFWFDKTKSIIQNQVLAVPDPNVMVVEKCKPIKLEVIIRGFITGSAWRKYQKLKEQGKPLIISGVEFPSNLRKDQQLPEIVFTPTTKAEEGHDEEITPAEIINRGILSKDQLDKIIEVSIKLYEKGNEVVSKQGGILVDTKYEFGLSKEDELLLIDEVHTADSSRYWLKDKYEELFEQGKNQQGLDKEYVRNWLREHGFTGDGAIPNLPEDVVVQAALNVINSYELITGQTFKPSTEYCSNERIIRNLEDKNII
jgi:phosphoribosylaminoimidazole-succinocarboxamide synthase